jgi:hypothetical protein
MGFFELLGIILGAFCCGLCLKSCARTDEEFSNNDMILIGNQVLTHRSVEEEVPPKYEEIDRQN